MCWVQLLAYTIRLFLCISILETLLHVTLKRRAEISNDIFACLLRYFCLSCKNLTIKGIASLFKQENTICKKPHRLFLPREFPGCELLLCKTDTIVMSQ